MGTNFVSNTYLQTNFLKKTEASSTYLTQTEGVPWTAVGTGANQLVALDTNRNVSFPATLTATTITAATFDTTSDIRLKEDVQGLTTTVVDGILLGLRPVSYRLKADASRVQYGFIAQEVEEVAPELTSTYTRNDEEYMSLNYQGIIALLVDKIKRLEDRVAFFEGNK